MRPLTTGRGGASGFAPWNFTDGRGGGGGGDGRKGGRRVVAERPDRLEEGHLES